MDIKLIVVAVLDDLALVSESLPNERMPEEAQIRCCVYAAIRPLFHVVCAERGYGPIDLGSKTRCELWASNPGAPPVWIKFKLSGEARRLQASPKR